ncbi:hypothetical protein VTK56DRAFT_1099 [Thermocarpiscus australiensis]
MVLRLVLTILAYVLWSQCLARSGGRTLGNTIAGSQNHPPLPQSRHYNYYFDPRPRVRGSGGLDMPVVFWPNLKRAAGCWGHTVLCTAMCVLRTYHAKYLLPLGTEAWTPQIPYPMASVDRYNACPRSVAPRSIPWIRSSTEAMTCCTLTTPSTVPSLLLDFVLFGGFLLYSVAVVAVLVCRCQLLLSRFWASSQSLTDMALGIQPLPSENWGRWPHHHPNAADYSTMGTSLVPYGCRLETTGPMQRPGLSQHFLTSPLNPGPAVPLASSQYQTPVPYGGYTPYRPSQMLDATFGSQQCLERMQPRLMPVQSQKPRNDSLSGERSPSPSVKSEAQMSTAKSTASHSSTTSKTIVPNVRVQGATVHEFNTPVDVLMRAIQSLKMKSLSGSDKSDAKRTAEGTDDGGDESQGPAKPKRKQFCCDIPGCNKKFGQKNNLETHRRAHTGHSPCVCKFCGERFTQDINLKTHTRRHTGEKPYRCPQCGKSFPQRANVKSHMRTHERRESYLCKLDNCNKTFTARGNLKTHQNKFHFETVAAWTAKFAAITDLSSLSVEEKEMLEYMQPLYENSNKGIKGRGKCRKVRPLLLPPHTQLPLVQQPSSAASPPTTNSSSSSDHHPLHAPFPMPLPTHHHPHHHHGLAQLHAAAPQQQQQQQQAAPPPPHAFHGLSSPAAYSMSSSSRPPAPPNNMLLAHGLPLYEDDQAGEGLAFGDRLY